MGGGCVIAASYEAKAFGVKTGMRLSEARKLCPKAVALPSDFEEALLASRQIEQILYNRCPLIEQYSVDEWFLDLRSLPGGVPQALQEWLLKLQETVGRSTGLTVSIGVGTSKLLAKMASEYRKPAGLTIVEEKSREAFLRDRPAAAIPGIGPRRDLHAQSRGWKTAWDIAEADTEKLKIIFGKNGTDFQRELRGEALSGIDEDPAPPKSVSRTRSFPPSRDRDMVYGHILHHLTYTMLKMRREGLACRAISVWLRDGEYQHHGRDMKIPQPIDTEEQALPYLQKCFAQLWNDRTPITQAGIALHGLNPKGGTQYSLFENPKRTEGAEKVQTALDKLHDRYGRGVIARGGAMKTAGPGKKKLRIAEAR